MPAKRPHNYDTTQARRQAKRRAMFARMREALRNIDGAHTLGEAKALAREGLDESFREAEPPETAQIAVTARGADAGDLLIGTRAGQSVAAPRVRKQS